MSNASGKYFAYYIPRIYEPYNEYSLTSIVKFLLICFVGLTSISSPSPKSNVFSYFQSGEICIRSPTVMKGYYKNEQATKESITDDGFFKTGDLGNYNPKHGLYIFDRIKELIKVHIFLKSIDIHFKNAAYIFKDIHWFKFRLKDCKLLQPN